MRIIRKIFWWTFTLVLLLAIQAALLIYFFQDELKTKITSQLNEKLQTEIKVSEINLSPFSHFPNLSMDFLEVEASGSIKNAKTPFIKTKKFSLIINFWEVYGEKVQVRKIVLENGEINILIDKNGNANYNILKSTSETTNNNSLKIENITLKNVKINYLNQKLNHDFTFEQVTSALSGDFSKTKYDLNITGKLFANKLLIDNANYLKEKNITLKSQISINQEQNTILINPSSINIEQLKFSILGTVDYGDDVYTDLKVTGVNLDIESFISILPKNIASYASDYSSSGNFEIEADIEGRISKTSNPFIQAKCTISDAKVSTSGTLTSITNLNLHANYSNGANDGSKSFLEVSNLSGQVDGQPFTGKFSVKNFPSPFLDASIKGDFDLKKISPFIKTDEVTNLEGIVNTDIKIKGLVKDIKSATNFNRVESNGVIVIKNVSFKVKSLPVEFSKLNGQLTISDKNLFINNIKGYYGNDSFKLIGSLTNFVPWVSSNYKSSTTFNGKLVASRFSLTDYLNHQKVLAKSATEAPNAKVEVLIPFNINGKISLDIAKFEYEDFMPSSVVGDVVFSKDKASTEYLTFNTMQGGASLSGSITNNPLVGYKTEINGVLNKLSLKKMLADCKNFGQDYIQARHVDGTISAKVVFNAYWTHDFEIFPESIILTSDLTIHKGSLLNFEPLEQLSDYVEVSELRSISFSTLTNQIEIKNKVIFIPKMAINSSAIDLMIGGTHDFDNNIDYSIRIILSQVLAKNSKKIRESAFGVIEDDGTKKAAIYVSMKGTVDNPIYSFDKQNTKKELSQEIKEEKQELGQTIKNEIEQLFGTKDKKNDEDIPSDLPGGKDEESSTSKDRKDAFKRLFNKK
ncbi:MAG: hypothetical protein ACJAZ3_001505 [Sphingobacteriales bacterium]|jgi:hypothetical protein